MKTGISIYSKISDVVESKGVGITATNRLLGFLRRNLFSCPKDVTEAAYKGLFFFLFLFCFPITPINQFLIILVHSGVFAG